jgi:hypothetical protein
LHFGTNSLYDALTKKYGYQEGFPSDDERLFMPEELYEIVLDQDINGEFFEPFEDDEDLDEIQHPDEETLVSLLPLDEDYIIQACSPHAYEDEVSTLSLDEDVHTFTPLAHQEETLVSCNPFENFDDALIHECGMNKTTKRILMKFLL